MNLLSNQLITEIPKTFCVHWPRPRSGEHAASARQLARVLIEETSVQREWQAWRDSNPRPSD